MCPITQFLDTSPNIEEVRQKIEDLREDIRILESYRNDGLLFVSRLPTEVLSLIFEYVATSKPRQKHSTRWMRVTQVCRLWRNVAIDTPRLWGTICVQNKVELAKLFLQRSKTAPLHIKSNHETPNLDVAALCLSNPSRLRTIELHFLSLKSASWVPLFKSLKAPSLETLVLTCHHPVQLELGTEVDADHVPLLRNVELYNCFFNLQPLSVCHIRSLDIEYLLLGAVAPRPMLEVMLALSHMKQLESLRLINLLEFSGDIPQDLHIDLPRLEKLTLKSKNPRVMLMLRNFTCINIMSVVVNTLDAVESGFLAKEIASSFCSVLPNTLSSTWLKLGCNGSELVTSIFLGSLPTTLSTADPTKLPPQASLQLFLPIDHTICLALLSVFQVPNLESLTPRTSIRTSIEFGNEADPDHVPPLHAVHVNDYFFNLQAPVLSHVRFLTVCNSAKSDVRRPMLEVMLALRDMKQLETLELTDLLEFSEDFPEDLLIEVPLLEQIRLTARDPRVVSMLRSFRCPAIRT
ncbi:hypothetical protein ONZ45_g18044 [Pleurotus djamor]|nr:hypothetical protein ONZ45_g18044 [Pleurotus djamor]